MRSNDSMFESYAHKGIKLEIYYDTDPESPREWDNLGTMICFHKRRNLGDKDHGYRESGFSSWENLAAEIRKTEKPAVILPLYLYDHSGITIRTGPFSSPWDSGQVGFIFISREKAKKEFGIKRFTKKSLDMLEKGLVQEVQVYDMYLTGEVFGYVIDRDGEHESSCWGYFGLDDVKAAATEAAEYALKQKEPLFLEITK